MKMQYHIFFSDLSAENQVKIIERTQHNIKKECGIAQEEIDIEKAALIKINAQFPITITI